MLPYLLYPRIYCVTDVLKAVGHQRTFGDTARGLNWGFFTDEGEAAIVKPKVLTCELKRLSLEEAYLLDNGEQIYLKVNSDVH
jgi:hypothetical protein